MQRDSFVFYRSFFEATEPLEKDQKAELFDAICTFALEQEEVELSPIPKAMFCLIKPQLEANYKKFINWNKAKQKQKISKTEAKNKQIVSKTEAKDKQIVSKTEANANANVNVNVNENVNVNVNEELKDFIPKRNWIEKIKWTKGLPKTIKITTELKKEWNKRRKEYAIEEIKTAVNNYCLMIWKLKADKPWWFAEHRFSLLEFLKQPNWIPKYINFNS